MFEGLKELSERSSKFKEVVQGEQQTKNVLIEPLLELLGFDIKNPFDIVTEYTCDFGTKKGEKVDYVLMKDGEVVMLVEAKDCKFKLSKANVSQLFRYYSVSPARVAILTNGVDFLFFTDTTKQNTMDTEPFFSFNIETITEEDAKILEMFRKETLDAEAIRVFATTSVFSKAMKDFFVQQANNPSNDFVSFITKNLGLSNLNSSDATVLVANELKGLLGLKQEEIKLTASEEKKKTRAKRTRADKFTGLATLTDLNSDNIIGTKPIKLHIDDEEYEVANWADVLEKSVTFLYEAGETLEDLAKLDDEHTNDKGWIRFSKEGMRTSRELKQTGLFIETHASAWDNFRKIKNTFEKVEFPLEKVRIELK